MNYFNPQVPRFLAHLPEDNDDSEDRPEDRPSNAGNDRDAAGSDDDEDADDDDDDEEEEEEDTSDTEDDSGIADETPEPLHFGDLRITDPLSVQNSALNNFFHYCQ
uniref:Uncharacterized protein n=1 Tax=Anopheles albimanus TaxID=7167 RepID=A0A182FVL5_ANOAL